MKEVFLETGRSTANAIYKPKINLFPGQTENLAVWNLGGCLDLYILTRDKQVKYTLQHCSTLFQMSAGCDQSHSQEATWLM